MNNKDLEKLLNISLSKEIEVDDKVNEELMRKVRQKSEEGRSLSIWWLPMILSMIMALISLTIAIIYIPHGLLQIGIIVLSLQGIVFSIILTVIGVKYFNLREEAIICL